VVDRCDTCGRMSELFQLPDRNDSNCTECNADISILVLLYHRLKITEGKGEDPTNLEAQLVPIVHRFLERSKLEACGNASSQFCAWPEDAPRENQLN
jgi:hypothetical protein